MKNNTLDRLGKKLRELRLAKGLSQEKVANKAQLHSTYISQVECGKRNITILALIRICGVLEISLEEIVQELGK